MTHVTKRDVVEAATSVLDDITSGSLNPTDVEKRVVEECRQLFGQVNGPGDALWPTHIDVTRQALALGALTANELAEWASVVRQREQAADA